MLGEQYFAVRYGDIVVLLYHEKYAKCQRFVIQKQSDRKNTETISGVLLYDRCESGI